MTHRHSRPAASHRDAEPILGAGAAPCSEVAAPGPLPVALATFSVLVIAVMLGLVGCQTAPPAPTPTPTRTPILPTATPTLTPTATPTLTPSPTVTPSPTLPPSLLIPAELRQLPNMAGEAACPPLPGDLYFLQQQALWVCRAEGGPPEAISIPADAQSQHIVSYQVTQDRRFVAYVTAADELFVLDRAAWQQTRIPTSGRLTGASGAHFALTADGSTLFYLAWGVQPSSGPAIEETGSAALLSIDITAPTYLQQAITVCRGNAGRPCGGFVLSPDEDHIVFVDAEGLWSVPVQPASEAAPSASNATTQAEKRQLAVATGKQVRLRSWSPDGAWLLLEAGDNSHSALLLLLHEAESVALNTVAVSPLCLEECTVGTNWDGNRLWLAWDAPSRGCIHQMDTTELTRPLVILDPADGVCQVGAIPLHPHSPAATTTNGEGGVSFLQPAAPGIWPGLYTYAPGEELVALALLPEANGTLVWSPSGDAFLYLDPAQSPSYLGALITPALWDVRDLLEGAHSFAWTAGDMPARDQ